MYPAPIAILFTTLQSGLNKGHLKTGLGWLRRPLESKWRNFKKKQYIKNKDVEPITAKNTSWLKLGLIFGSLMFCFMSLPQIISGGVTIKNIVFQVIIWLVAGLAFGATMKLLLGRRKNV